MITIKLGELESILKCFSSIVVQKISISLAYRIGKLVKRLQEEFVAYDELRQRLCKEHCTKDKNDQPMIKDDKYVGLDHNPDFRQAILDLQALSVEVDFEPIPISLLEKDNVLISSIEASVLDQFIKE